MKIISSAAARPRQTVRATDVVSPSSLQPAPEQDIDPHADSKDMIRLGLRLSFIIYDPLDHVESALTAAGFHDIKKIQAGYTGTQGICAIRDNTAYVVFRGSASAVDWVLDFLFLPSFWPLCHFGFGWAWRSVRGQVTEWLNALPTSVDRLIICGHSLGGGIAHLASMELAKTYRINGVVTFGAPKACFLGTAKRYNETKVSGSDKTLKDITCCVVNQRDIVAKVPFELIGYRDVGQLVYIDFFGNVHYGDAAWRTRGDDSLTDIDYLFNFMEAEQASTIGTKPRMPEGHYTRLRQIMTKIGEAVPLSKTILLPCMMYILVSLYFLRSGLAHMGDKYLGMFAAPGEDWSYIPYEKTRMQAMISLSIRLVLGVIMLGLFLWGLVIVGTWTASGLMEHPGRASLTPPSPSALPPSP